jgi:hypothetical protein
MLASALISIKVAPELAETRKLCPKKDIVIDKFNQLLARLTAQSAASNATDLAAFHEQEAAIQKWLEIEAGYRTAADKAAKAKDGAAFAQGQFEKWKIALAATKERQEKAIKAHISEKAEIESERALIMELLDLIDKLQTQDTSINHQAVLQQFRQKVSC